MFMSDAIDSAFDAGPRQQLFAISADAGWAQRLELACRDKAKRRVESMVRAADVPILASHSSHIIAEWCNRLIWLEQGGICADGKPFEVLERYLPAEQFRELASLQPSAAAAG
jgi:lipopolysaccharide transport system ATP-binding protein